MTEAVAVAIGVTGGWVAVGEGFTGEMLVALGVGVLRSGRAGASIDHVLPSECINLIGTNPLSTSK